MAWYGDRKKHSLCAKGYKTGRKHRTHIRTRRRTYNHPYDKMRDGLYVADLHYKPSTEKCPFCGDVMFSSPKEVTVKDPQGRVIRTIKTLRCDSCNKSRTSDEVTKIYKERAESEHEMEMEGQKAVEALRKKGRYTFPRKRVYHREGHTIYA